MCVRFVGKELKFNKLHDECCLILCINIIYTSLIAGAAARCTCRIMRERVKTGRVGGAARALINFITLHALVLLGRDVAWRNSFV